MKGPSIGEVAVLSRCAGALQIIKGVPVFIEPLDYGDRWGRDWFCMIRVSGLFPLEIPGRGDCKLLTYDGYVYKVFADSAIISSFFFYLVLPGIIVCDIKEDQSTIAYHGADPAGVAVIILSFLVLIAFQDFGVADAPRPYVVPRVKG